MSQQINKISLLVHPFYSVSMQGKEPPPANIKRNMSQIIALWKKQVQRTAREKDRIFLIVTPFAPKPTSNPPLPEKNPYWGVHEHKERWYFPELQKFFVFAKKALGNRMFTLNWEINTDTLQKRIKKRGFRINNETLGGSSFGEWWDECVPEQRDRLIKALNTGKNRFPVQGQLSLTGPYDRTGKSRGHISSKRLSKPSARATKRIIPVRQRPRGNTTIRRI